MAGHSRWETPLTHSKSLGDGQISRPGETVQPEDTLILSNKKKIEMREMEHLTHEPDSPPLHHEYYRLDPHF